MTSDVQASGAVLMGCGDVGPVHGETRAYAEFVRPTLEVANIRFAQCERVYSERGELQVHSGGEHSRVAPSLASIFSDCEFNVVSVASNHAMDWGPTALLDSIDNLQGRDLRTVGAGKNLAEARAPAILEVNGLRVAVLAFCSVLREGYAATEKKPGVAPLRAHAYYESSEYQPGVPPRIVTIPYEEDLAGMLESVAAARKAADVVVLSVHWGVHFIPRTIADYQVTIASAAVAAGVDLILGHHAHVPKAITVIDGRPCFFSLSNFIMSTPERSAVSARDFMKRYGVSLDPDYPRLPYGTDGKRSLIVRAELCDAGGGRTSFLPVQIDKELRPRVLSYDDPKFKEMLEYMEWASEGFEHEFKVDGDEVVVTG
jgi:poly-gamma-glutamate synthesis protein (capsule biosynthesis protein)